MLATEDGRVHKIILNVACGTNHSSSTILLGANLIGNLLRPLFPKHSEPSFDESREVMRVPKFMLDTGLKVYDFYVGF